MSKCQDPHYNVFERKSTNFIVTMLASSIGCILFGNGTRSDSKTFGHITDIEFLKHFFLMLVPYISRRVSSVRRERY